ncbi:hypothetical protein [Polaromonas aquatica]|uniref:hypothetical protein n=1 Tax=Polaromonas aquatica TaxID=332657 RepID=UPI003D651678
MNALHRKKLGIQEGHRIVQRDIKVQASESQVTSTYWYDEIDERGEFVRGHVLRETNFIQKDRQAEPAKAPEAPRNGDKENPDDLSANSLRAHIRERMWLHNVLPHGRHRCAI